LRLQRQQSVPTPVLKGRELVAGIRTVTVTAPALLTDLIDRLAAGRIELDIVAQLDGRHALGRRLQQLHPDLVIIGLRRNETDRLARALLMWLPVRKCIALSHDGRSIVGYELQVHRVTLSDRSPEDVVDFIGAAPIDRDD